MCIWVINQGNNQFNLGWPFLRYAEDWRRFVIDTLEHESNKNCTKKSDTNLPFTPIKLVILPSVNNTCTRGPKSNITASSTLRREKVITFPNYTLLTTIANLSSIVL